MAMASNTTTQALPIIASSLLVLIMLLSSGAQAYSDDASPPAMAALRADEPVPPPLPHKSIVPDMDCPMIAVPALIDACRRPPGLAACAAQCLIYHYRGGYCDVMPNGRPGDCFCKNCLVSGDA